MKEIQGAMELAYQNYVFDHKEIKDKKTIYKFNNETGDGCMICYDLLPGIQVAFDHFRMDSVFQPILSPKPILQIDFCYEGAYEYQFKGQDLKFFAKGDFAITDYSRNYTIRSGFPFMFYEGLTIFVDLEVGQQSLDTYFHMANIDLCNITEKIIKDSCTFTLKNKSYLKNVLSLIYESEEKKDRSFWILKVIEMLMYLKDVERDGVLDTKSYSKPVYEATKECYNYILKHPFERLSIEELSNLFSISESSLKRCFHSLTGTSIGVFIRENCIQASAKILLEEREMTIQQVAEIAGYANQSKFIKAFKRMYNETPLVYRNGHV